MRLRRIAVVGSAGAGKSTLARVLGERLHIEVIHLDRLYWQPGWVPTERQEWAEIQRKLVSRPTWIIDGNYGSTMDLRLDAADTVIFLDLPRSLCLWRAIQRAVRNWGKTRPDMGEGCPEKIDWPFLVWIWRFPQRSRPALLDRLALCAKTKAVIHLRSPRQVAAFLKKLAPARPPLPT